MNSANKSSLLAEIGNLLIQFQIERQKHSEANADHPPVAESKGTKKEGGAKVKSETSLANSTQQRRRKAKLTRHKRSQNRARVRPRTG